MFLLETPEGSWLLVVALLGLMPTGIDVSLQASEWGKAKRVGLGRIRRRLEEDGYATRYDPFVARKEDLSVRVSSLPADVKNYCRRWFEVGLLDFRVGHVVSFVLACLFMLLAAVWLYPSAVQGPAVMGEIALIFTRSVGAWTMVVFLLGAFAATYSTAFNYFDGWPRLVAACCRNLFRPTAALKGLTARELGPEHRSKWYSEHSIYRGTMIFSLVSSVAIITGWPKPVLLVLVSSALALFIAPVTYYLNIYFCLTVIPKTEHPFSPSRSTAWLSGASFVIFTALTAVLVYVKLCE